MGCVCVFEVIFVTNTQEGGYQNKSAGWIQGNPPGQVTSMEPVRDYELKAFFVYVINVLERPEVPYMVVVDLVRLILLCVKNWATKALPTI